jgi:hypothetical protein
MKKVTFVLGAGSSAAFGFPTGLQLKDLITKKPPLEPFNQRLLVGEHIAPHLLSLEREKARHAASMLRVSGSLSIDAWLEHNPQFQDWGRYAIARQLLRCERDLTSHVRFCNDWDAWLFDLLTRNGHTHRDRYRFISFNYDRSFEVSLVHMLQHGRGHTLESALAVVNEMPILHVYGTLAQPSLSLIRHDADKISPTPPIVAEAAKGIQIMSDARDDLSEIWRAARDWIRESQTIIFLGFRFDPTNLRRLGLSAADPVCDPNRIGLFASAFGLTEDERRTIEMDMGLRSHIQFGQPTDDSYQFLRSNLTRILRFG